MRMRGWTNVTTFTLACAAAWHQAITGNVGMWLAFVLAIGAVLYAVSPLSEPIARMAHTKKWGLLKIMIAIAVASVCGAVAVGGLVKLTIDTYRAEQEVLDERKKQDVLREARERELSKRMTEANDRITEANKRMADAQDRQDRAERRREQQLAQYQTVNASLIEAIGRGGSLRYRVEDAVNVAVGEKTREAFHAWDQDEFEPLYARVIDSWREDTSRMLDAKLPKARLGRSFNEILGEYGKG